MSLLNELETHARRSNERQAVAEAASRAREELDEQRARPLLKRIENYLRRAADALNDSDQIVTVDYVVPEIGELKKLQQAGYLVARDPEHADTLRFSFSCTGTRTIKGVLSSEALARAREKVLVDSSLSCKRVAHAGDRRALLVEPRVPVTLGFQRSGSGLTMRTRNLLAIESRSYPLSAEQVDDGFLEALLEVILRRGNRLPLPSGDAIPDANRQQMRLELARRERRRRAELSGVFSRALFPVTEAFRRLVLRQ